MKQRIRYLLKFYLLTVVIFIVGKVGFMLCNASGHPFSTGDVLDVLRHGLSLDLSMALYLFCIPFLCVLVSIWLPCEKVFRYLLRVFYVFIAIAMALAFVADTSLYKFWLFKLDASCLQYLETPTEAMASVTTGYLIVRVLIFVVLSVLFAWAYWKIPLRLPVVRQKIVSTLCCLLGIPLIVVGIRGGLSESTTNIGQVYFSQNQFLNHSAVNPVFSFFASLEKTAKDNASYEFFADAECEALLEGCYPTESVVTDSLLRIRRPNVVIILLEGCGEIFSSVMPRLNELKREGIWFANCYGNSFRTDRGTVCALSGYPSFPTMSVMKMPKKTAHLPSIARSLQREGYTTSYLYGGDINFTNMRSYLVATGWEELRWKADFSASEQASAKWGVRDDITFRSLRKMISSLESPFLIGFSTLSTHEPWDVPIKEMQEKELNAFYYLDQCIGDFFDDLKKTPHWRDLLVVLVPDHGINYRQIDENHPQRNHIPMLWIGGAVKEPRRIDSICNQTDLPATLLGQMGIRHDEFTFSRDVLSKNYTKPFAIHTYNNGFSMVDDTGFTVYDLNTNQTLQGKGNTDLGKAILQVTSKDLKNR